MKKRQIEFFATRNDLVELLGRVENEQKLIYVPAGSIEYAIEPQHLTWSEALAQVPMRGAFFPMFLVVAVGEAIHVRDIVEDGGKVRHALDQLRNPRSLIFRPGGFADERTLLPGQIGTASDDPLSKGMMTLFSKVVRQQFNKIKSYWIGDEALAFLDGGGRLTSSAKAAVEYDLKR